MTLGTDLASAVAIINTDSALMRAIVQGPASGPNSVVVIPSTGALVKTLSRVAAEAGGPYARTDGSTPITSDQIILGALIAGNTTGTTVHRFLANYNSRLSLYSDASAQFVIEAVQADNPANKHFLFLQKYGGGTIIGDVLQAGRNAVMTHKFLQANDTVFAIYSDAASQVGLEAMRASDPNVKFDLILQKYGGGVVTGAGIRPISDNTLDIGTATFRWANIRAGNGTIVTSDGTYKRWGSLLAAQPGLVKVGLLIPEILGTFQFLQSIEEKGKAAYDALSPEQQSNTTPTQLGQQLARWHIGLTVQELVAVFDVVRQEYPDMPTPAQLGLYGRDPIKTRVPRVVKEKRPRMLSETYTEIEYALAESGDHFVAHTVSKTRQVPAPPTMKPVLLPGGVPRMVKVGERRTGVMDAQGHEIMEPVYGPETHPVPTTDDVDVTVYDELDQGAYILSTRPEQIHYLCIGAAHIARKELEARIAAQELRLTALEAAAT